MFKVVKAFRDANNEDHFYAVGAVYPVEGVKPSKTRINELKGKNKFGVAFIEEVKEEKVAEEESEQPAEENASENIDLDGLLDTESDEDTEQAAE